ncbi:MAG: phage portal protein, partial [Oscillospiraceae bacterium]|nr:phage portal protein [Oscillospiraceae bacterium]
FTEGTTVTSADLDTERFLQEVLKENHFYERFPAFLEKVFALGGGAVKVYWDNGVKLDFVEADSFIPTKWDNIGISGAAFCSKLTHDGKSYRLAEAQELSGDELVTENRLYSENGASVKLTDVLPALCEKSVIKGLSKPLFVYIGTGHSASSECSLLGASVFAGAEDTLKSIDVVFDSLEREFVLGKKRIIVPYYAVRGEYDENGDIKRYFDVNDEVFQAMSVSDTEELKITDNTAELRVEEHTKALSMLLDMLCMQVGLSEGTLSYMDGTIKTAAEVVSRSSKTYRTGAYYRAMVSEALAQVMQNICVLGKMGGLLSDGASEKASLMLADGAAEDDGTRIERAVMLYNAGIISKVRAISQIYGISIEEAMSMERSDNDE